MQLSIIIIRHQRNKYFRSMTKQPNIKNERRLPKKNSQNQTMENDRECSCILHEQCMKQKDLKNHYKDIGVLKSYWINSRGQKVGWNTGTAYAVNNRIIITCTHNIFAQGIQQFCSFVEFYPNQNHDQSSTSPNPSKVYRSTRGNFYKCMKPLNSFESKPIMEQVCLIALSEPLEDGSFIRLGNLSKYSNHNGSQISIVGYPCTQQTEGGYAKRYHLQGTITDIDKHIINHTCQTVKGISGSPIMIHDQSGWKSIGIHTHKSRNGGKNSGIYFTGHIINMIKQFQRELKVKLGIDDNIQYRVEDESRNYQCHIDRTLNKMHFRREFNMFFEIDSFDQEQKKKSKIPQYRRNIIKRNNNNVDLQNSNEQYDKIRQACKEDYPFLKFNMAQNQILYSNKQLYRNGTVATYA